MDTAHFIRKKLIVQSQINAYCLQVCSQKKYSHIIYYEMKTLFEHVHQTI